MRRDVSCAHCGLAYPIDADTCPHCGRQGPYPNVSWASLPEERTALQARYDAATVDLHGRGLSARQAKLEALLLASEICRALPQAEFQRLFSSDSQVATTYHEQVDGCARLPDNDADFDRFRRAAETAVLGAAAKHIHYAVLSPDGRWLRSYGQAAVFLREDRVAHRSTVFEGNVVLWFRQAGIAPVPPGGGGLGPVPAGHRAVWDARALLGVAKLAPTLSATGSLPEMILHPGHTTLHDSFLEVHVYGPYTLQSVKRVAVQQALFSAAAWQNLLDTAAKHGIDVVRYRAGRAGGGP